jgi:hypothetical protein
LTIEEAAAKTNGPIRRKTQFSADDHGIMVVPHVATISTYCSELSSSTHFHSTSTESVIEKHCLPVIHCSIEFYAIS